MKRKLIELGGSLFVSLPSKYIQKFSLKKGHEVEIEVKDSYLEVSTSPITDELVREIDISNNQNIGKRYVTALYRKGVDHLKISYEGLGNLSKVKDIISTNTIGYEVINEDAKLIEIKDYSTRDSTEFNNLVRRLWLIIQDNAKDLITALETGNKELLNLIISRDKEVNKFSNYCSRQVFKGTLPSFTNSVAMYNLLRNMESVSDCIKEYAQNLLENNLMKKQGIDYVKRAVEVLRTQYSVYYEFSLSKLDKCAQEVRKIEAEIKVDKMDFRFALYLITFLKKLDEMSSNLLEIVK